MGIRDVLNRNPLFVGIGVALVAGIALTVYVRGNAAVDKGNLYFTADDGKTFFVGPVRATPYMQGGHEVDQAMVFSCDGRSGKPFVGFLFRYTDKTKPLAEKVFASNTRNGAPLPAGEVKKPGDSTWVPQGGAGGPPGATPIDTARVTDVTCPNGRPTMLLPN